jgi:hypothetical protein
MPWWAWFLCGWLSSGVPILGILALLHHVGTLRGR